MSKTYSKTRILVECALMIAIGTVLSNIKFFTMPNGGSITLLPANDHGLLPASRFHLPLLPR